MPPRYPSTSPPAVEKPMKKLPGLGAGGPTTTLMTMMPGLIAVKTKKFDGPAPPSPSPRPSSTEPTLEQLAGVDWDSGNGNNNGSGDAQAQGSQAGDDRSKRKPRRSFELLKSLMQEDEMKDMPRVSSSGGRRLSLCSTTSSNSIRHGSSKHHHPGSGGGHNPPSASVHQQCKTQHSNTVASGSRGGQAATFGESKAGQQGQRSHHPQQNQGHHLQQQQQQQKGASHASKQKHSSSYHYGESHPLPLKQQQQQQRHPSSYHQPSKQPVSRPAQAQRRRSHDEEAAPVAFQNNSDTLLSVNKHTAEGGDEQLHRSAPDIKREKKKDKKEKKKKDKKEKKGSRHKEKKRGDDSSSYLSLPADYHYSYHAAGTSKKSSRHGEKKRGEGDDSPESRHKSGGDSERRSPKSKDDSSHLSHSTAGTERSSKDGRRSKSNDVLRTYQELVTPYERGVDSVCSSQQSGSKQGDGKRWYRSKSSDMMREYHELLEESCSSRSGQSGNSRGSVHHKSKSTNMLADLSGMGDLSGVIPPPALSGNFERYDSPRPQFGDRADSPRPTVGVPHVGHVDSPMPMPGVPHVGHVDSPRPGSGVPHVGHDDLVPPKAGMGGSLHSANLHTNKPRPSGSLHHLYPVKGGGSPSRGDEPNRAKERSGGDARGKERREPSRPRRLSPHPVRGFADPSLNQQHGKSGQQQQFKKLSSSVYSDPPELDEEGTRMDRTTSPDLSSLASYERMMARTASPDRTTSPDPSVESLPMSEAPTPDAANKVGADLAERFERGLESLKLASQGNRHRRQGDGSDGPGDKDSMRSDASEATAHTLDSLDLDAQKAQTAEQLRDLIEMMQAEFHKLRQAKVDAEMKAQTLETDLVSSQQESDAAVVRLSEEMERWKRIASQEKVRREAAEDKAERLEGENREAKAQWGRVARDKAALEERCESLEGENRRLKKALRGGGRVFSVDGGQRSNRSRDDSSATPGSATSPSVAATSKVGSPSREPRSSQYRTPPGSPLPFESVLREESSGLRCPQSVHTRRPYCPGSSGDPRSSSGPSHQQAPASWHGGKGKRSILRLPVIAPPLEAGSSRAPTGTRVGAPGRSNHLPGQGQNGQDLRRKSSMSSASTYSTTRSASTYSTAASVRDAGLASVEVLEKALEEYDDEGGQEERRGGSFGSLLDGMVVLTEGDADEDGMDGSARSGPL